MRHINLKKVKSLSSWRKVSMNTWKTPTDPSTYGVLKFDATSFAQYAKDQDVSVTQLFTKVVAASISEHPQINRLIRGANLYQRVDVDIFLQVSVDEQGHDLSGTVIRHADKKSIQQIKNEISSSAKAIRNNEDDSFKKVKGMIGLMPNLLARPLLALLDLILYRLNIYTQLFGVKADPFGSCMITSVGNFGAEFAFAPIPTISHVPLVLSLFKINDEAVVKDKKVVIQETLTIGATLDHRIIDGVYASKLIKSIEKYILAPDTIPYI